MSPETQIVRNTTVEKVNEELIAQLRKVPILSSLKDEELRCLEGVNDIHLDKEEIIARQGEMAHFFWILLEGEIRVYQTMPNGNESTLYTLESGATFGELPLLANIPNTISLQSNMPCRLLQLDEEQFWGLMTSCPQVRKAILGNMALRFQKLQGITLQQEKMASLGTLAAGLMHELNNPGSAARRAAQQLRDNLMRMHEISSKFSEIELSKE